MRRLFARSKKSIAGLCLLIGIAAVAGFLAVSRNTLWGQVVNLAGDQRLGQCVRTMIFIFVILAAEWGLTVAEGRWIGITVDGLIAKVRTDAFGHLMKMEMKVVAGRESRGQLLAKMSSNVDQLCEELAKCVTWFARAVMLGLFSLAACMMLCWQLALFYVIMVPLFTRLMSGLSLRVKEKREDMAVHTGDYMDTVSKMSDGFETIKAYHMQGLMEKQCERWMEDLTADNRGIEKANMWLTLSKFLMSLLQIFLLFMLGYYFMRQGVIRFGDFVAFVALSENVRNFLDLQPTIFAKYRKAEALAQQINTIFDCSVEPETKGAAGDPCADSFIEFRDVFFSYDTAAGGRTALSGVSLQIPRNKCVGIIGASGSGKSTIVKLICRFYRETEGQIYWQGTPAEDVDTPKLRSEIGIVTQEAVIFQGSVAENVLWGNEKAGMKEVIWALKGAQLWEEVRQMEQGVDTKIGEGGRMLSGGQRQRLAIARALIKRAPLIILDEATSALDAEADYEFRGACSDIIKDKTVVIVTHKINNILHADYLYCMEKGRVVEEGRPEELYIRKGYFYDMVCRQSLCDLFEGGAVNE